MIRLKWHNSKIEQSQFSQTLDTISWYFFTKQLREYRTHIYFRVAPLSHFETAQTIGHISFSAAELAPFRNFCNSGASTGPALQWRVYW
jgi:hypothetical protein